MNTSNIAQINQEAVLGTLPRGETFGINADAAFFDILSNSLYSNPYLAVVRETITNALDATDEAKVTKPVEVTLKDGVFRVKDYGLGIPHEKMHEIYCTYGNTTKQDKLSTGGFGLGCKSPFALVNTFTVSNCYQGICKTYILKKDKGIPKIISIEQEQQDTNTGLTVTIPIPENKEDYLRKNIEYFLWYSGAKVIFNENEIKTPNYTNYGLYFVKESYYFYAITNIGTHTPYIFLRCGYNFYPVNILYPPLRDYLTKIRENSLKLFENYYSNKLTLVINVPINSIDITPNREELRYTDKTKETLNKYINEEIDKFNELNCSSWFKAYKTDRLACFAKGDTILRSLEENNCFTSKDVSVLCKGTNEEETGLALLSAIATSSLFTNGERYYAKYYVDNHKELKRYYEMDTNTYITGQTKANLFLLPFKEILKKEKISVYWFGKKKYEVNSDYNFFSENKHYYRDSQEYLYPLYKIVIISNYSINNQRDYLDTLREKNLPITYPTLIDNSFKLQLKSYKKALTIKKELEENNWYVINLIKEEIKTTKSNPTIPLKEKLKKIKDKNQCYYYNASIMENTFDRLWYSCSDMSSCYINSAYLSGTIHYLSRINKYKGIKMINSRQVNTFQNFNIRSMDEVLEKDVKDILQQDQEVLLTYSLLEACKYHIRGYDVHTALTKLLWFVIQNEHLCERYNVPKLNEEQLNKLCLVNSLCQHNNALYSKIKNILKTDGRVAKLLTNLDELFSCSNQFTYVLGWVYHLIWDGKIKEISKENRNYTLVINVLDSLFLIKGKDNA